MKKKRGFRCIHCKTEFNSLVNQYSDDSCFDCKDSPLLEKIHSDFECDCGSQVYEHFSKDDVLDKLKEFREILDTGDSWEFLKEYDRIFGKVEKP